MIVLLCALCVLCERQVFALAFSPQLTNYFKCKKEKIISHRVHRDRREKILSMPFGQKTLNLLL